MNAAVGEKYVDRESAARASRRAARPGMQTPAEAIQPALRCVSHRFLALILL